MKAYRNLRVFVASFFVLYAGLGVLLQTNIWSANEIFPIYSWALFSKIPNERDDYALRILVVGKERVDPPLHFQAAGEWFPKADSISAYYSVQKLGRAISREDAGRIEDMRRFFEPLYFGDAGHVRYEVVKRSFNPLDRWENGNFKTVRSIGVFESIERTARTKPRH